MKAHAETGTGSHAVQRALPNSIHAPHSTSTAVAGRAIRSAVGNQALQRLLQAGKLRTKVQVGSPIDPEEREADVLAAAAVDEGSACSCAATGRPCAECGGGSEEIIRRKPRSTNRVHDSGMLSLGSSRPLAEADRSFFESRYGADLSDVHVHDNPQAAANASQLHARAFAVGSNIVFGRGEYRPHAAEGRLLLAHELAHVVQQAGERSPQIRRQPDDSEAAETAPEEAAPAEAPYPDDRVLALLNEDPATRLSPLTIAGLLGGLKAVERNQPRSYPVLRELLVQQFGETVVQGAYDNDDRIVHLVGNSQEIDAGIGELYHHYFETEQWAAVDYLAVLDQYEWSYGTIFERYAAHGEGGLVILELFMGGDPQDVIEALANEAEQAQAEQLQREADEAEWRSIGESALGEHVATREILWWFDADISLESLVEPTYGAETQAEAVAWARMSGQACVVRKVEDRYYIYASSDQFSYNDVFLAEQYEEHRTEVVPAPGIGSGVTLITAEGYVLTRNGPRYFGGAQSERPEHYAEGTSALLERTASLTSEQALALFKHATLDILLINLREAEKRLRGELTRALPLGFGRRLDVNRDFGVEVKRDADDLRSAMVRATDLINRSEAEELSEEDELDLMDALETVGRLQTTNPGAAMMIETDRDPESTEPVEEGEIESRVAEMSPAEAAWEVATEIDRRLENIDLIRRHFLASPDETLSLAPLHEQVLPRFTTVQQLEIRLAVAGHQLGDLAAAIGLPVLELVMLITGAFAGGPLGVLLAAGATGLGAYQTAEQLEEAERLRAGAALDVPGGFQLASEQEAASATRWAYISVALTVLDVGELATGNRILRLLGRGAGRAARGVGAALTEGVEWARRTLGLPADVLGNLTISGINRLKSLPGDLLDGLARLSVTLKRFLLGCTSPCRVDLQAIRNYLTDPERAVAASQAPLSTLDEVVAALPVGMNRTAIEDQLRRHPALLRFITEAGISADDLSGLSALDVVSRGDRSARTATKTFSRFITSLVPAKVGPNVEEFNRIVAAAGTVEQEITNALKGPMFENYARLYVSDFRFAGFVRRRYTQSMIPGLERANRSSDGFISRTSELWDFKHTSGVVDAAQVRDYRRILVYEAGQPVPAVTSVNYLFPTREAAEANRRLLENAGFAVWYLSPTTGRRVRLRL